MTTHLKPGDRFPDLALPDQNGQLRRLSQLTRPGPLDQKLGFNDGYPLVVVFYRGYFCPRDNRQMRELVQFQQELQVSYIQLVTISVEPSPVQAAFRAGLGATWPFLSDESRAAVKQLNILDETEGEYAYVAQPYTFVLRPDLTVHRLYNGWFYVGRPTLAELRRDLRDIMASLSNYGYEAYNTPAARQVRIPQQTWAEGAPPLGASRRPVVKGVVVEFDLAGGNGLIDAGGQAIFFNFTAIPGHGYRTLRPGAPVRFELVENATGLTAWNVQTLDEDRDRR